MENARNPAAIPRGFLGESRVHSYSPSLHRRAIRSVLVRLCFCHFTWYECLLSPLGIGVKRTLLGLLLMRILNDGFYKPLENPLQWKLKDPVISPSSHLTRTIFRSEIGCGGEEKEGAEEEGGYCPVGAHWTATYNLLRFSLWNAKGPSPRAPSEPSLSVPFQSKLLWPDENGWGSDYCRGLSNPLVLWTICPPCRGVHRTGHAWDKLLNPRVRATRSRHCSSVPLTRQRDLSHLASI